jgi:hypothetical protein
LFKLFKRIFSSVAIFFCFLYLSTPVSAQQFQNEQIIAHCCSICNDELSIPAIEGALQGPTNWCLATCMNIVHWDILNKGGGQLRPSFNQGQGNIADFARFAFILRPVQNEARFPFQSTEPDDIEGINYIRLFSAHLGYPSNEEGINLEWRYFQQQLKAYTVEKREEMWEGKNFFPALPNRLKQLLSIDDHSVPEIFNKMANPQPPFHSFCQLISAAVEVNHWEQIYQDIWEHERMVILNMENTTGGIGHSFVAYAAVHNNENDENMIFIYNPDGGNRVVIFTNSHHSIGDYQISSYCIFNY